MVFRAHSQNVCLYLTVDGENKLYDQPRSSLPPRVLLPDEFNYEESLAQFLSRVTLTRTAQRILGIGLARMLLSLIVGAWLSQDFSVNDFIIYFRIKDGQMFPFFEKLFVYTEFNSLKKAKTPSEKAHYSFHPFPVIVSLGIALAEIVLGEETKLYERRKTHSITKELLHKCQQLLGQNEGILKAISACFDRKFFHDLDTKICNKKGRKVDLSTLFSDEDFIDAYCANIIRPLEVDLLVGARWTEDEIRRLKACDANHSGVLKVSAETKQAIIPTSTCKAQMKQPLWPTVNGMHVSRSKAPNSNCFNVGIICALPKEFKAVRALFESDYANFEVSSNDDNHYAFGNIGHHKIVAACLPHGEYGTNSAAAVTSHISRSFPTIKFFLLVGIGGGAPTMKNDIRLGDVVVSLPKEDQAGVIQYDLGRALNDGVFQRVGTLQRPLRYLLTALSSLISDPHLSNEPLQPFIRDIIAADPTYKKPQKLDRLFEAGYLHNPCLETCSQCRGPEIKRAKRQSGHPQIHYGLIASANQVMQDTKIRDRWAKDYDVLCFEMEAAGVMITAPTLVIRGICDYADSHKNYMWQEYASATAAAYAKLLLSVVRPVEGVQ